LIIDAGHRRWFVGTLVASAIALSLYFWCDGTTTGGVTGGTTPGLWFGVAGTALMVFCGAFVLLRQVPAWWWIGSRKAWLKAHIWLGLLSVVLILCHSGIRIGGLMGEALWVVLAAIVISGIYGVIVQQTLPGLLTRKVPEEASYEQINHFCGVLRGRADDLCDAMQTVFAPHESADDPRNRMYAAYESQLRPFFSVPPAVTPFADEPATRGWFDRVRETLRLGPANNAQDEAQQLLETIRGRLDPAKAKDLLPRLDKLKNTVARLFDSVDTMGLALTAKATFNELQSLAMGAEDAAAGIERLCAAAWLDGLEDLCVQRGKLRVQERIHDWLHGWLLLHVPLSAALLILTIAHVVMSLFYY
jgi:hypothetical protein